MEGITTLKELTIAYPNPIATIISKYLRLPSDNLSLKHSALGDLFETTIKFIAIVAIKEAILTDRKIKQRFPSGLDFLQHPSLGHWVSIIREFGNDNYEDENSWLFKIALWYKSEKPSGEVIGLYESLQEIAFPKGNMMIPGIIESLTTYRNKVWKGHGAVKTNEKDLKNRIGDLEKLLVLLLTKASFLKYMNIFYAQEVKKINATTYQSSSISLVGNDPTSSEFLYENFEPKEIYLAYSDKKDLDRKPLTLSPLIEWQQNEREEYQIYFFNLALKTKLEYLSYNDGTFYYHKEIKAELEKVFNVQLEKGEEQENYIIFNFSEEERKEKNLHFFQKGLELYTQGKYEAAIIACEDALEWFRNAQTIVLLCRSMLAKGENQDFVLNYLENAFEIDPLNDEAANLKRKIDDGEIDEKSAEIHLDYYELIIPDAVRNYSLIFFILIFAVFFGIAGALLFLLDPENARVHITFSALAFIQTVTIYIGLASAKNRFLDSYFPLLRQQAHMSNEKFKQWFENEFKFMFGHFIKREPPSKPNKLTKWISWSWKPDMVLEKTPLLLLTAFALVFSINTINIQVLYKYELSVALIRFLETCMLWLLMTPVIRFIIASTLAIKDYSNQDLKPVVSSFNNNGFSFLKKIFFNALLTFDFFWITLWAWNLAVAVDPLYFDFLGLAFALVVGVFWIIYTPMYIDRALNISKSNAVSDYDDHINKAFEKFIKKPEKSNLENLDWLRSNENTIRNISTRLFSFFDWLIYFLSLALVIGVSLYYVLIRLEILSLPSLKSLMN